MSVLFCLSIILLQGCLSLSSEIPPSWSEMLNNIPEYIEKGPPVKSNCTDDECRHMEVLMNYAIKESIPACDDFYTHACGNWIHHHPLIGQSVIDQYTMVKQELYADLKGYLTDTGIKYRSYLTDPKAKQFYASCTNEQAREKTGLKELRNMVTNNGGWSLFSNNHTKTYEQKWQDVHKGYSENYDQPGFFHLQVLPNRKNSTKHIITLTSTFIDMHELSAVKSLKTEYSPQRPWVAYRNLIKHVAQVVNPTRRVRKEKRVIKRKINSMISFQQKLKKLSYSHSGVNSHLETPYTMTTIKNLQTVWDNVLTNVPSDKAIHYKMDWLQTIRSMFAKSGVPIVIDDNEVIAIEPGDYIKSLARLLSNTQPETIVNYIHWNAIKNMLKYGGNKIEAIIHEYNKVVYGAESQDPRWLECIQNFPMEHALTARMGHTDDLRKQQKTAEQMFYRVEGQFMKDIIAGKSQLKGTFLHKFSPTMGFVIGYPEWSRHMFNVSAYYESLEVEHYNYFVNMVRFNKFARRKEFEKLRLPVDRLTTEWPISPTDFVAAYDDRTNSVILPAALFRHPYMGFHKVPAIQYGALGSIIGHEMAHSIDSEEHLSDGLGETDKWSTRNVSSLYENLEQCYRTEYNRYNIELKTNEVFPINTDLMMREIIADNMGFRMAFRAFKEFQKINKRDVHLPNLESKFTQDQIFFYSLAQSFCENPSDEYLKNVCASDEHPPANIRINGALSTMEEFHDAFQCRKNARMNRAVSKCSLW